MTQWPMTQSRVLTAATSVAAPSSCLFHLRSIPRPLHGARLSKNVMQIVANADEGESFVEELANPGSAKQKETENHAILLSLVYQCLRAHFRRGVHVRILTEAAPRAIASRPPHPSPLPRWGKGNRASCFGISKCKRCSQFQPANFQESRPQLRSWCEPAAQDRSAPETFHSSRRNPSGR